MMTGQNDVKPKMKPEQAGIELEIFREAVENSTDAIGMSTPQGFHYYQNQAFSRWFGEVGPNPSESLFADVKIGREVFRTIMSGKEWIGEVQMFAADGSVRDFFLRAYANTDDQGQIVSLVGIHTDITNRKRTEAQLQHRLKMNAFVARTSMRCVNVMAAELDQVIQEALMNAGRLTASDRSYLVRYDAESRTLTNTHEWCDEGIAPEIDVLQNTPSEIVATAMTRLHRFEDIHVPRVAELKDDMPDLQAVLEHQGIQSILVVPFISRGALAGFIGFDSVRRSRDWCEDDRQTLHVLANTLSQVFERSQAEDANRTLNDELERRVTKRTSQLRNLAEQLVQSEQRERERIARILHDDLQQILVSAQYHMRLLSSLDRKSLQQAEAMIGQALQLSSSLTRELSPTILYEVGLEAALPWLGRQMKTQYGLNVHTHVITSVPADDAGVAILLFQSVRELLFNVVKHAQEQEAWVELGRTAGEQVYVTVFDRGCGFDARQPLPVPEHSGLFTIRERMEQIGGTYVMDSAPGRGTSVCLTVRVSPPANPPDKVQPETTIRPSRAAPVTSSNGEFRVLIADDHALMRQGIADTLNREPGILVVGEAADGAEAVAMALNLRPDVIVMDVSMPVMNGIEATRSIRKALSAVFIIGLSMYDKDDRAQAMLDAGANTYLSKIENPEKLVNTILAFRNHCAGGSRHVG